MGRKSNYQANFFNEFEKLNTKLDNLINENKNLVLTIYNLRLEIEKANKLIAEKDRLNEKLLLEIERLKNNNNKNSSNSSKPSSTNGFKNTPLNNREKSNKKQGAQKGHKGTTLTNEKIEKMIEDGEIDEVITVEENKKESNKHLKPIIRYIYDLQIIKKVTKIIEYPDKPINITKKPVTYGNNIKAMSFLLTQKYMSLDGVKSFFDEITNNAIKISKGSLYNWNTEIAEKLANNYYNEIENNLLNSLVLNVDETPIKINGKVYYVHNISNGEYTMQYVSKHRGEKAIEENGFLKKFTGILVHDHFLLYYKYGSENGECNTHILRYLNGVIEYTVHKWAIKLKDLFKEMREKKENYKSQNINKVSEEEYELYKNKYLSILEEAKTERLSDLKKNAYKEEEIRLINRLIKYCDNHLLFLKKFMVPFSNNRAEADLRGIKIKQKIGKFRSVVGAESYIMNRSCHSSFKKQKLNSFEALIKLLENKNLA